MAINLDEKYELQREDISEMLNVWDSIDQVNFNNLNCKFLDTMMVDLFFL